MATTREERLALNEALFRTANERMAAWEERERDRAEGVVEGFFCECADTDCREKVRLPGSDYERVRANSKLFFVRPGHELPDVETVIESHAEWVVVEKDEEVREIAEATDPRKS